MDIFEHIKTLKVPAVTEAQARKAGRDCKQHGANEQNCHFKYFSRPELTRAWEEGSKG